MSINPNPLHNDSTMLEEPAWQRLEDAGHTIQKALRKHDAGKAIDVTSLLTSLIKQLSAEPPTESQDEKLEYSGVDLVNDYWDRQQSRKESIATGIEPLSQALGGGLEPGRLVVVLGAPGGGKTTLINQISVHAANSGRPVLYVTSEDVPQTLFAKTLARTGRIDYKAVLKGYETEKTRIDEAMKDYADSLAATRLHYLDATTGKVDLPIIENAAKAHFEHYKEAGQGILVIDYLQRLARAHPSYQTTNGDIRKAVTGLTEHFKALAVELDCCVICLASMNRASGYEKANNALSSAKESGDIEYTADVMMAIIDDPDRVPGASWLQSRQLKIDKNRQGETASIKLDWYGARQQFTAASIEDETGFVAASNNGKRRGRA